MILDYITYKAPKNFLEYILRFITRIAYMNNQEYARYIEVDKIENFICETGHKLVHYTFQDITKLPESINLFKSYEFINTFNLKEVKDKFKINIINNSYFFITDKKEILEYIIPQIEQKAITFSPVFEDSKIPYLTKNKIRIIKKYNSYYDILENLLSCQYLIYENEDEIKFLNNFLKFFYPEINIYFTNSKYIAYISFIKEDRGNIENIEITKTTNIIQFLVPSFEKECGISEYYKEQRNHVSKYFKVEPIMLCSTSIKNILLYNNVLFVHHEPSLFDPRSSLSEDTYQSFENYIKENPQIIFNIYFHYIPQRKIIYGKPELESMVRIIGCKNVYPIVFSQLQLLNIAMYQPANTPKKIDHGFYELPISDISTEKIITFFGFNANYKNITSQLIQNILSKTDYNIQLIGKGMQNFSNDRIQTVNNFCSQSEILNLISKTKIFIFNGIETNGMVSGSYRYAISTGKIVLARNSTQYTSIEDTNSSFTFYDTYDNLYGLLQILNEKAEETAKEKAIELVKNKSISKLFYELYISSSV